MKTLCEHALEYAELGWSVIPLEPRGKRPMIQWEPYQSRQAGPEEILAWWKRWPKANIGIVTGRTSEIMVLDVDGPKGDKSLHRANLELPATVLSLTGNGMHYFFRHPGRSVSNRAGMLPGLDIRGDGGYVVGPPSVHASGRKYTWAQGCSPFDTEPAPLPKRLQQALEKPQNLDRAGGRERSWLELLQGVREGGRNDAAARLAGLFINKGLTCGQTTELLLLWNTRNHPPLNKQEVIRVARSIANRAAKRILG